MSEPRRPHQASAEERIVEAAREEIAEAREEFAEVARAAIDEVRELAIEVAVGGSSQQPPTDGGNGLPTEDGGDPVSVFVESEIDAIGNSLTPQQKLVLADLLRLHLSLSGPQQLLENTANFNRPTFPAPPRLTRR